MLLLEIVRNLVSANGMGRDVGKPLSDQAGLLCMMCMLASPRLFEFLGDVGKRHSEVSTNISSCLAWHASAEFYCVSSDHSYYLCSYSLTSVKMTENVRTADFSID